MLLGGLKMDSLVGKMEAIGEVAKSHFSRMMGKALLGIG